MSQFSPSDMTHSPGCVFSGYGWGAMLTTCATCTMGFLLLGLFALRRFMAVVFSAAIFALNRSLQ